MQITEIDAFIRLRLMDDVVMRPKQAVPMVGYMAWPNDATGRARWLQIHKQASQRSARDTFASLKLIQKHWTRVADIVHLHFDLAAGAHQQRRGGVSIGKSISLVAANAKSAGTGTAKLWEIWKAYKDVAHLVTAAVLIAGEAQMRHRRAPYGLKLTELQPYRMAMLLPDLVMAVAMTIESYGLKSVGHGRNEPMLDPESLWRIPPEINLTPLEFQARPLTRASIAVLNARRAGNRGKVKTTPVSDRSSRPRKQR